LFTLLIFEETSFVNNNRTWKILVVARRAAIEWADNKKSK
jgi:hypothetical protein